MSDLDASVFIANSPLHLIYARALVEEHGLERYEIHWFGKASRDTAPWFEPLTRDLVLRDHSTLGLNDFRGFVRGRKQYLTAVAQTLDSIELLYTCHNNHFAFEALRRRYAVPWRRIGAIEDGIGSYFPWRMIPLHRQALRSVVSLLAVGQPLSIARNDLGGDARFAYVATIAPSLVHLHSRSRARIVDLRGSVRRILAHIDLRSPSDYDSSDVLLFLPPVLTYGRLTHEQLRHYVERVQAHPAVPEEAAILVKPHPRDGVDAVRAALKSLEQNVSIGGDEPVELYLRDLTVPLWAGSPTTGMLNNELLYPNRDVRYALFPIAGNPNLDVQVEVLRKVLGKALVAVEPTFRP